MTDEKKKTVTSFKKAQSLISKIIEMIEKDEYCVDIMQQNMAAIGLLKSAHQKIMEGHLYSCFLDAVDSKSKQKKQKMVDEILQVTKLSNK